MGFEIVERLVSIEVLDLDFFSFVFGIEKVLIEISEVVGDRVVVGGRREFFYFC